MNCFVLKDGGRSAESIGLALIEKGIECRPGFYPIETLAPTEARHVLCTGEADFLWRNIVCLPSSPSLTEDDVRCACFELASECRRA